jgi:hypothetical protein
MAYVRPESMQVQGPIRLHSFFGSLETRYEVCQPITMGDAVAWNTGERPLVVSFLLSLAVESTL